MKKLALALALALAVIAGGTAVVYGLTDTPAFADGRGD
jgi:branched-subunit amino acid ABC-type transport system permease component